MKRIRSGLCETWEERYGMPRDSEGDHLGTAQVSRWGVVRMIMGTLLYGD